MTFLRLDSHTLLREAILVSDTVLSQTIGNQADKTQRVEDEDIHVAPSATTLTAQFSTVWSQSSLFCRAVCHLRMTQGPVFAAR